jgi:hypothetical protein
VGRRGSDSRETIELGLVRSVRVDALPGSQRLGTPITFRGSILRRRGMLGENVVGPERVGLAQIRGSPAQEADHEQEDGCSAK